MPKLKDNPTADCLFQFAKATVKAKDSSAITELFQLMIEERVKCLTCNTTKQRQEAQMMLSVPIIDLAKRERFTKEMDSQVDIQSAM